MKKLVCSLVILLVVMSVVTARAEEATRTVTIKDAAGVTSEVTDLIFLADENPKFPIPYPRIALSGDPFDIAIPIDNLISIEARGGSHAVSYLWRGKKLTMTGKLFTGEFRGKSDFGDFKLDSGKLQGLKFHQPPKPEEKEAEVYNRATLTMKDRTQIAVDTFKRHDSFYYSGGGYLIESGTRYEHYTNFYFLRGESLATVEFAEIKRIEFEGKKGVSVTLKNGKKASGTISTEKGAGIVGFTGAFEKGEFFVAKEHVKAIEFGIPDKQP